MKLKINVSDFHIACGVRHSAKGCPIVRAINSTPRCSRAVVGYPYLYFKLDDDFTQFGVPKECLQFMKDFDAGKPVKAFSFELEINEPQNQD